MIEALGFDEAVEVLLRRMRDADHLNASTLHEFKDLMADQAELLPDHFYDEAFEELQTLGFLHPASGQSFGGPHGRLSANARAYLRQLDAAEGEGLMDEEV